MSIAVDNNISTAVYRSNDPISNFKIRVKLERLTSNALLPSLQRLKVEDDLERLLTKDGKLVERPRATRTDAAQALEETERSDYEEVVIGWQQKLFSRAEVHRYGKGVNPESTALEHKYYDAIQRMITNHQNPGRIFTYVESDPNCLPRQFDYFMTDSPNEEPSQLALGINNVRKRHVIRASSKLSDEHYLPKTNLINRKPTVDDIRTNHLSTLAHQTMYIMADLSDKIDVAIAQLVTVPQPIDEHMLCKICVYSNGTIVLEPDFNNRNTAYIVETGNFNNEVYHYYLEHASTTITNEDLLKERKLFDEVCLRQQLRLAQFVGKEFDIAPASVLLVHIFGEIVSGKNFEYDDLYVYYRLDFSDAWSAEPSMISSGYTPTASATASSKNDDIIYYSHPFEFKLWYIPPRSLASRKIPPMPKIYFQVATQDTWGRHRTEGYSYLNIPNQPGFYNEELSCWRPRGDSIFNELRRFFIGGSNELEDLSYVATPNQFEIDKSESPLSRFGFRTVSTGSLNVRFNVVFQSETIAMEHARRRDAFTVYRHGFDAFMSNINVVIDAYQEAKKRALEVRESTLQLLSPKQNRFE